MPSRERACGGFAVMSAPSNTMRPARRRDVAADQIEQRRLAGAVGADDGERLAVIDGEAQRIHGLERAVGLGHFGQVATGLP